ncbi:MAG: FAD-binding protein [Gemmatimonadales bacterium]|nr:FAD-binding protein [Gemmatimonadales bacterium]MYL06983.1 FAD-binding protein [Gemmatimonadales bacterium]
MTSENPLLPEASTNLEDREACAFDFGRMTRRVPEAVVRPRSAEEVASLVRRAAGGGVRLAIRGGGHSQGGQTLTDRGVVLDTAHLDRVQPAGPELVRAQGGAPWGKVVDTLRGARRLPCVLPDIGEVTVGGTLSAGGFGTTSHRYGAQVGQVEQLDVVTGTGERVRCSATRNVELFDAVRSGQGQFGIITEAWIRLRPAGRRFRQYELHYRDAERFADALERIVEADRFDHLRAEFRNDENLIVLNAGIEYDEEPDDGGLLARSGHDKHAYTRDTASVGRAAMYPPWCFSRLHYHPWRDWILPWGTLRTLLAEPWLESLGVPRRPWSWTGLYPIGREAIDAPLFMRPRGERAISYSILARLGEFQPEEAIELASRLEDTDRTLVGLGGKTYLSGGVGYGPRQWADHYGEMLDQGIRWKREFDPEQVFNGAHMPFGDRSAVADAGA